MPSAARGGGRGPDARTRGALGRVPGPRLRSHAPGWRARSEGRRNRAGGAAFTPPQNRHHRGYRLPDQSHREVARSTGLGPSARWPFATIAAIIAGHRPDLVVHLGDYYYRESSCPDGEEGCAGSPFGDRWSSWNADFFAPARPLLRSAPWVFVRGNHEGCERGGKGWYRFLRLSRPPNASRILPPISSTRARHS